jgi:hypothetical protein
MVTNEVLVATGSGLARKFVSPVLWSPPATETFQYKFPYSRIGGYKLQRLHEARNFKIMLQSIFPSGNFLRTFHDQSRHDLSKIYLAYVKLTYVRQSNSTHLCAATHKVTSG